MPPTELWEALSRTHDYPRWWTWLRRFDSDGLVEGGTTRCEIRAPLPYSLRFDVDVHTVEPERLVDTRVRGDIEGPARLEIDPLDGDRSAARLCWTVEVRDPLLRAGAVLGRPVMQWGHEWVVATGVSQFRSRALS